MSAPRPLAVQPLTREAFAPYGDVIEAGDAQSFAVNSGTAQRFNDLAHVDVAAQGGHPLVSIFRGQPISLPMQISEMERHPLGSQVFMPIGELPFLIVVAADAGDRPGEPVAFLSNGRQGVNYRRGTWHHPLLSLDVVSDFLVLDRGGAGENCDVAPLPSPRLIDRLRQG